MRNKDASARQSGYTLAEMMVAVGIFSIFALALLAMWSALATTSLNTISYSQTENDQMRAFDYLKRDIRRATTVAIFNGSHAGDPRRGQLGEPPCESSPCRNTNTDTRQEDDAIGPRAVYTPTLSGSSVTYGTPFTVQYYISNKVAIIRNECGNSTDGVRRRQHLHGLL